MTFQIMLDHLRQDLARYRYKLKKPAIAIILLFPGFQAVAMYRISRWLNTRSRHGFWWLPIVAIEAVATRIIEIITGIYISPNANVGPGLYFPHFGCIFIGNYAAIGKNCDIYQGVTLGYSGRKEAGGYPTLADRVVVAAGAKVLGPIHIGNDAMIGANAVVTKSMPEHAVVVGIPAKVHSVLGSFDHIRYPGYQQDEARLASLARQRKPVEKGQTEKEQLFCDIASLVHVEPSQVDFHATHNGI
jgi:serine O-acetyltransferase